MTTWGRTDDTLDDGAGLTLSVSRGTSLMGAQFGRHSRPVCLKNRRNTR